MYTTKLNGQWKLYGITEESAAIRHPDELANTGIIPIPANVPGNVELDLMAAGQLDDPLIGDHIWQLAQYELYEWWYEKEFELEKLPEGRTEFIFHGVDCLASYWLNGTELGSSDNMFIEHRFEVGHLLNRHGVNRLHVRLASVIVSAAKERYDAPLISWEVEWERLRIRKAPHSYGWNIMPRALSAGLWRDVELAVHEECEIADLFFHTIPNSISDKSAGMFMVYQLELPMSMLNKLELRVKGHCGDSKFEHQQAISFTAGMLYFHIQRPKLWWPRGYGEASLYEVEVELLHEGRKVAAKHEHFGIREVELIRSEITSDVEVGEFMFKVNGSPILCMGTNWVSADVFHSRDADRLPHILELAKQLNCNMIRCWGGNVYEDHAFFDECDRSGLMIWQDFAMACAPYPQDPEFLEKMRMEAVAVVRKLHKHPSLVLWCGDNECDYYYKDPSTNRITREVLPQVVLQCDPTRDYLPSSPYMSGAFKGSKGKAAMPEEHLWGPRDYYKSSYYTEHKAHFVSEIGYHGCPNLSSINKFIDPDKLWPWHNNEQWILHSTDMKGNPDRNQLMADEICELFGEVPDRLEDFIIASQISQAEAKKSFIEMTRLSMWRRTGILWWNLIDGWPQFSDAVVDYYFGKKLAFHYIRRVQQSVCIMFGEPESWHVKAVVGNASRQDAAGRYRIFDADNGLTLLEGDFKVKANENKELGLVRVSRSDKKMLIAEWTLDGVKHSNHYLLGQPPFELKQYVKWMSIAAAVCQDFEVEAVGK